MHGPRVSGHTSLLPGSSFPFLPVSSFPRFQSAVHSICISTWAAFKLGSLYSDCGDRASLSVARRVQPVVLNSHAVLSEALCPLNASAPSSWWWDNYHHSYFLFIRKKIKNDAGFLKKADLISIWLRQTFTQTWTSKLNLFPQALSQTHLQVNLPHLQNNATSFSGSLSQVEKGVFMSKSGGSWLLADWVLCKGDRSLSWLNCLWGGLKGLLPCSMGKEKVHDTIPSLLSPFRESLNSTSCFQRM